MKNIKDICFLILAKSNSQRLPGKMHRPFVNTTLLDVAIKKLLDSEIIPNSQIYIAGHGPEVIEIAKKYKNVNLFKRSDASISEEATIREIYEIVDHIPHKFFVEINACCPLLSVATLEEFIEKYIQSDHNGLFGVVKRRTFYWNSHGTPLGECTAHLDTKRANIIYEAAHCLYAGSVGDIRKNIHMGTFRHRNDPAIFVVENEKECWDVDYEWQLEIAASMFKNLSREEK